MRRPSPAMSVALAALFVALGGVGVAATGGNFILGKPDNAASSKTGLLAPVNDKALQITNTSGQANATALGLTVAAGHAPITISPGAGTATNLNADLLDGRDSSGFLRRQGTILVTSSGYDWAAQSGGSQVTYYSGVATLGGNSSSGAALLSPDLPVALYGSRTRLEGVQLCYDAADPALFLDRVALNVYSTTTGPNNTIAAQFVDDTDRNDVACRTYDLASPYVLTEHDSVALEVIGKWSAALGLDLSRATFVLSPSSQSAIAP
jgi:hypothetical protein